MDTWIITRLALAMLISLSTTAVGGTRPGADRAMHFAEAMEQVARGFEIVGALVLILGLAWSGVLSIRVWRRSGNGNDAYQALRRSIGGVLLLGLEILVAADLLHTVAIEPTLENVAVLGLIVIIRTVLSFSLEIEIEGMPPWRRAAMSGATHIVQAAKLARPPESPRPSAE